ncbi:carbon-nitrogen family hydrolase [Jeotgalibacillus sp. R-1-5s-1]|nr:carbon-nitrogen family hydrolase [Jeotgalibacillus sp. R-1-5s-1]TFE03686.1 carbon-nitrogen family hydrolase [Jeotgalibacillus sp. R-1-5s-1]
MNIAIFQMDIVFGNPEKNYEKLSEWMKNINADETDTIVLPELWTTGYDLTRLDEIGDKDGKQTTAFLQKIAKSYQVNVIGGSFAKQTDEGVFNTMIVVDRNGDLVHEYSKLHLFKLMNEHHFLQPGKDEPGFLLEGTEFAGFICYDIRFPEWIRKPVLSGAKVIVVSAEWPSPRIDHWLTLLKARAIENQSYVIACNRVGSDPDNEFGGRSIVIDPWGKEIAIASYQEEILYAEIDLEVSKEVRSRIPVFEDRRPDFY